ncbi:hypothetical protein BS47DRAFT_1341781 [Hydnum rufescens UP504]|uniref:Uncharacterized protein n=1 Tax=Hydnum rufescens UP504 TaxID=1448309 RepID=A0A9P6B164_9AGAM|nr:hypothetical protein BS47DRAFT_1341781 [Hydnum rufescens UP504]
MSALTLWHGFQHEFDQASPAELVASRSAGPIRCMVSKFFSGLNTFLNWVEEDNYRRQAEVRGEREPAKGRTEILFLR